jgi:hypothetical protein
VTDQAAKILDDAKAAVTGPRQEEYGAPAENFARIAAYWSTYLEQPIQAHDVAIMMTLLKVARGLGEDTCVDAAGYAALAWEVRPQG